MSSSTTTTRVTASARQLSKSGVFGLIAATLLLGCAGKDDLAAYEAAARCVDDDGDGFGPGCGAGGDCDAADPAITNECYYCVDNDPGCPCDVEGEREACGIVTNRSGDQLVCGFGERVCAGGEWAECLVNNASTIEMPEEPGLTGQTLGNATPCTNNPCSLNCQEFVDDPTGLPSGNGIQSVNGSLGLIPGSAPVTPTFCLGGAQGTCNHSVCSSGSALTASCDVTAPPQGTTISLYAETFANNLDGWTLGSEWAIGPTAASSGHNFGNADPAWDHTPTGDNGVAGIVIAGNASTGSHGYAWLTSPVVDVSAVPGTVTLSFARWYNFSGGTTANASTEVWNGTKWIAVQTLTASVTDNAWTTVSIDITAHKNAALQVRFGYTVLKKGSTKVSGLNVDDVNISTVGTPPLPAASCVKSVCAVDPTCCSASWTPACVAKVPTLCGLDCANVAGTCALCYRDSQDHDSDGYSYQQGDCLDCDATVNPGAYDFPGNGDDEDCSGVADDETTQCDTNLTMTSSQGLDHAKAMDLCRTTTGSAIGKQRTWGVLSAALVQADGTSAPHASSYGILSKFGAQNLPFQGAKMGVYSSGSARSASDSGYVNPNGQYGSLNQGKSCAFPPGFPKNAAGCPSAPSGTSAYDSSGLWLKVRVPTNALSMSYKFNFFSSEYPEYVCTSYNDSFIALLSSSYQPANPAVNSGNISFDSKNNPISVNISFFTVVSGSKLTGTGFDGTCAGQICGGGTDWLESTAPVVPGETITLQFAVWDTGDHVWDSTVLIDDFQWSVSPATIKTFVPQPPAGPVYSSATFTRDYDVSTLCPQGTSPSWGLWSWSAKTPGDSQIQFSVQTASTLAGLASAPSDPLVFTSVPGPASLVGKPAVAAAGVPDTQGGAVLVETTLNANERAPGNSFLRITSTLMGSSDGSKTPTLNSWNQQFSCVPSE